MTKTLTFDELMTLAHHYYNRGGDGIVECWDRKAYDEYVDLFGPMTWQQALAIFETTHEENRDQLGWAGLLKEPARALSIRQPHAALIAAGRKTIETRSRRTSYRGVIYIHASAGPVPAEARQAPGLLGLADDLEQVRGAIIAWARLVDCVQITPEYAEQLRQERPQEYAAGYYTPGRWAWILEDVHPLRRPIYGAGRLGLWKWDAHEIPDGLENLCYSCMISGDTDADYIMPEDAAQMLRDWREYSPDLLVGLPPITPNQLLWAWNETADQLLRNGGNDETKEEE